VEEKARELIQKVDALGGSVAAIEQGFIQNEIARSAYEYQRQIENKEKIIVGVNKFTLDEENKIPLLKIDDIIRETQTKRLQALRATRNNEQAQNSLCKIETAAKEATNLMPVVIEAVENFCTLGEIANTLRKVFGEYK
jgi:methylmalonyl-CoA mutase N-terminal domain/subunit